jgi:hypothetical protein
VAVINRGYIKLWRKALDGGWLQNSELWAFWTWCLLKASHKVMVVMVGFQEITLHPGQLIFGRDRSAQELKLSPRKIRTCIDRLKSGREIAIKTTNKFSIITIVNWPLYQTNESESDQQNDQPPTSHRPQTRMNKNVKKKTLEEISSEISTLTDKIFLSPEGKGLFVSVIEAVSSTRKTGRTSPSVILSFLLKLERYPEGRILTGIRTYLEKEYYKQPGKGENYLLGIIRNLKSGPSPLLEVKSSGSPLLDAYYRKQDG